MKHLFLLLICLPAVFKSYSQVCEETSKVKQIVVFIKGLNEDDQTDLLDLTFKNKSAAGILNSNPACYIAPVNPPDTFKQTDFTPPAFKNYILEERSTKFYVQTFKEVCSAIFTLKYKYVPKYDLRIVYDTTKVFHIDEETKRGNPLFKEDLSMDKYVTITAVYGANLVYTYSYDVAGHCKEIINKEVHTEKEIRAQIAANPNLNQFSKNMILDTTYHIDGRKPVGNIVYELDYCKNCK